MHPMQQRGFFETLLMVGAPLALATLEVFHPHPGDVFQLPLGIWLAVHYTQIVLFPLAGIAVALIVRGASGVAAGLARVAAFIFAVTFVAFDTAAGVVTGVLVQAAQSSGAPEAWRPAIMAVWTHPIIGGAPGSAPVLAVTGSIAWSVALVMTAVVVRRARQSWIATLLLIVSAFALSIFKTHAWPGGPLSFGALGFAAAWLRWGSASVSAAPAT
jgi:hypothetical protein